MILVNFTFGKHNSLCRRILILYDLFYIPWRLCASIGFCIGRLQLVPSTTLRASQLLRLGAFLPCITTYIFHDLLFNGERFTRMRGDSFFIQCQIYVCTTFRHGARCKMLSFPYHISFKFKCRSSSKSRILQFASHTIGRRQFYPSRRIKVLKFLFYVYKRRELYLVEKSVTLSLPYQISLQKDFTQIQQRKDQRHSRKSLSII